MENRSLLLRCPHNCGFQSNVTKLCTLGKCVWFSLFINLLFSSPTTHETDSAPKQQRISKTLHHSPPLPPFSCSHVTWLISFNPAPRATSSWYRSKPNLPP